MRNIIKYVFIGILTLIMAFQLTSCSSDRQTKIQNYQFSHSSKSDGSTVAGNLAATSIKDENDIDVVLVPTELIRSTEKEASKLILKPQPSEKEVNEILNFYPEGDKDKFKVGVMKGRDIVSFIKNRSNLYDGLHLQVAGLFYHIHRVGGETQYAYFNNENKKEFDVDRNYTVAVSDYLYMSSDTFPGYFYGADLQFTFKDTLKTISLRESVKNYLSKIKRLPFLKEKRARVSLFTKSHLGFQKTYEVQSNRHKSPMMGHRVKTSGVVTAFGVKTWYPRTFEFLIQDFYGDGKDDTSDALHVVTDNFDLKLDLGDFVTLEGEVIETFSEDGLSRTGLSRISNVEVKKRSENVALLDLLPPPVVLGYRGRKIPNLKISTYKGDLNEKDYLNLIDGIDFWESLEGMRVQVSNIRVTGFRGGREEFESMGPKSHLSIYFVAEDQTTPKYKTKSGGIYLDHNRVDFNPDIMQITNNHFSRRIDTERIYNIGDQLRNKHNQTLTGVLSYEQNIFGNGEYVFSLPMKENLLNAIDELHLDRKNHPAYNLKTLNDKGSTQFKSAPNQLVAGTFNVENLSSVNTDRIKEMGRLITKNLHCPDLLNLVEIQDNNGEIFTEGSSADKTLRDLISSIECEFQYESINIDPVVHAEGGVTGGNIRVAMIYNPEKLKFVPRGNPESLTEARIDDNGSLMVNPSRVAPDSSAFKRTRRSLVAEFHYKGEKLFVIGNHFKSKLGDTSFWSNIQPPVYKSEKARAKMADEIRGFVNILEKLSPGANVLVMGDFNAFIKENPMKLLESETLINLMSYKNLIPENGRYTHNYNGNSQPLDYIYANKKMISRNPQIEIIHVNSDFMGRISDHDPVISVFKW